MTRRRWPAWTRSRCSASARGPTTRASSWAHGNAGAVARSAGASTGCRWRSSWRPPAAGCSSPREIAERLDAALGALGAGARDAPARQQTLRATIDWSHDAAQRRREGVLRALCGLRRRRDGRRGRDDHRRRPRHARPPRRQEPARAPPAGEHAHPARDARNDPRVRRRAPRGTPDDGRRPRAPLPLLPRAGPAPRDRAGAVGHATARSTSPGSTPRSTTSTPRSDWAVDRRRRRTRRSALCAALGAYWLMRDRYADAVDWIDRHAEPRREPTHPALRVRALCIKACGLWQLGRAAEQPAVMAEAEAIARGLADPLILSQVLQPARRPRGNAAAGSMSRRRSPTRRFTGRAQAGDDWAIAMAAYAQAMAAGSAAELRERVDRAAALLKAVGNVYQLATSARRRRLRGAVRRQRPRREASSSAARSRSRANSTIPSCG